MITASLPPADEMYAALANRDASYDGIFFTAVRTTGIFCRPICPARTPARPNVEFFASTREALFAGYRAGSHAGLGEAAHRRSGEQQRQALDR
jgi:methylphosphotriester-DNA--protein-cysteine methyltransferase